jgi:hypothetical protein
LGEAQKDTKEHQEKLNKALEDYLAIGKDTVEVTNDLAVAIKEVGATVKEVGATVVGQDWTTRFGEPFVLQLEKIKKAAAGLLTDKEANQFLQERNILLDEEGTLMQQSLRGLQETIWARIRANEVILARKEVAEALRLSIEKENKELQDQIDKLRQIELAAIAVAAAKQGAFAAGFAGKAPANLTAEAGRTGIETRAGEIFERFSARKKRALSRDVGVADKEDFVAHFFGKIEGMMAAGLDRADAELKVTRGLTAFAGGGISGGGLSLVGERGPEIVSLPRGAEVFANGSGPVGGSVVVNIDMSGAIVGLDEVQDIVVAAVEDAVRQTAGRGGR